MNLNDLLVSYKQVKTPDLIPNIVFDNTPTLSYQEANDTPQKKPKKDTKTRGNNVQYFVPVGVSDRTIKSRKPSQSSEGWKSPYTKRDKWTSDMIASYRKAGLTNDNAIKMLVAQDALESRWGRSAQGRFNFGNLTAGAKWDGDYVRGNDHDAKGNPIKQKFRSYNSMDEYAVDKLQFLKHLYDFDENDDINTFTAKLTGKNKGKRRYAEATDYADRVAAVFKSFKNGGVIKAQAGTIVADNTRVVKPTIQEKIQRTYPEQPQFVQDNRSDWQRQQSQKRAKTDYNQYMEDKNTEKGLRNLNGFLNFIDYATMGLGAGSLLFKGAKWAGKRAVGQVSKQIANSRNMGIVAKPFQRGGFQSELDWSPKSWFEEAGNWKGYTQEDIDILASHIPEYHEIERVAKANGTWLKLPNGKTWEGDPRSWVQLQSRDGQKMMMPSRAWKGGKPGDEHYSPYYNGRVWMSDNADVWNSFAYKKEGFYHESPSGVNYSLTVPRNVKMVSKDAKGKDFLSINHLGRDVSTDEVVDEAQKYGFNTTTIFNVVEGPHVSKGLNVPTNDFIIHAGTPRKSILGNNGNFNLNDKNLYRGFVPLGIVGGIGYGNQ